MQITPTLNRKAIATKVAKDCSDSEERQVAKYMTHSLDVARASYQHLATTEQAISVYSSLNKQPTEQGPTEQGPPAKRRKFTQKESEIIKEYFNPQEASKPPCADRARAFLKENQTEGNFEGRNYQHIQDKVKTFIRQIKK